MGGEWHDVASLEDLREGEGFAAQAGGVAVALFREGSEVFAVEARCPHQGAALAEGLSRDGTLTCPLHFWQFRLADGANVDQGPGVRTYRTMLREGRVLVEV
jgi:CDP-4-dehydro-6-deoxyglucose reductase